MDKLQHIDDLLRKASQVPANALVDASDWAGIEKRLKRRKNRIYALWFFLALSLCTTSALFIVDQFNSKTQPTITQQDQNIDTSPTILETQDSKSTQELNESLETKDFQKPPVVLDADIVDNYAPVLSIETRTQQLQYPISTDGSTSTSETTHLVTAPDVATPEVKKESIAVFTHSQKSKTPNFLFDHIYGYTPLWVNQEAIAVSPLSSHKPSNIAYDKPHWETGISFTPSLSSKISGVNKDLSGLINRSYDKFVANSESSSFGNTFGFNAQYHPKGQFFYSSGLFLTQRGEEVAYNYTITEGVVADNRKINNYFALDPRAYVDVNYKGSNSYHFIEIPLNIGYKQPLSRNFELRTQVGVSYLSLLNSTGKKGNFTTLQLQDLSELNFNKNHIAANLKSGIYYHRPRVAIGLEPMIGMNLTNLQDRTSSAVLDKPYSYGINLTTNFKFFKK